MWLPVGVSMYINHKSTYMDYRQKNTHIHTRTHTHTKAESWVLNAHNDEILTRVWSLRAGERSAQYVRYEREGGLWLKDRTSAWMCYVQRSVYSCYGMDWSSPDAVCRHVLSPASPRRCTHKADMAQPDNNTQKHSPHPLFCMDTNVLFFWCCFIVHTNCNKLSLLVNFSRWMLLLSENC